MVNQFGISHCQTDPYIYNIDREREREKKIHIYIVIEYDIWKNMESFIMESLLNAIDMFSVCEFP